MTTYNGYEYNECGVCLNPDKAYDWGQWGKYHFDIRISETPRGWVYGPTWNTPLAGGGSGCWYEDKEVFPSKSKAIVACAENIKKRFISRSCESVAKAIAALDRIISEESGKKPRLKEFTIFDYL